MPEIACRLYTMWRGKASFPKFVHVISKWNCSMSSYRLFLLEMNLSIFRYISVHSLTNRHLKPNRMFSHFVFILGLRSSTTSGSALIVIRYPNHGSEQWVSSPGQTSITCWALVLCAICQIQGQTVQINVGIQLWRYAKPMPNHEYP